VLLELPGGIFSESLKNKKRWQNRKR